MKCNIFLMMGLVAWSNVLAASSERGTFTKIEDWIARFVSGLQQTLFTNVPPDHTREWYIAMYHPRPVDRTGPLAEERVMTKYWRGIASKPQMAKNAALHHVCRSVQGDHNYPCKRLHMAAALMAGAVATRESSDDSPLCAAILYDDIHLAQLALSKGADPNGRQQDLESTPYFFGARSVAMAEICRQAGARMRLHNSGGETVLHTVSYSYGWDPELIRYYRRHGVSPCIADKRGYTPLHILARRISCLPSEKLQERCALLLEGLPLHELLVLCNMKDKRGCTALDLARCYEPELYQYLSRRIAEAQGQYAPAAPAHAAVVAEKADEQPSCCAICLVTLGMQTTSAICGHVFCAGCLANWLAIKRTCPICRSPQ